MDTIDKLNELRTLHPENFLCRVYLIGNSHLTSRRSIWQPLIKLIHPSAMVENLSRGGGRIDLALRNDFEEVIRREQTKNTKVDSIVIIMTGDNDLRSGSRPCGLSLELSEIIKNCHTMVQNIRFVVCGILPTPTLIDEAKALFDLNMSFACSELRDFLNIKTYFLDIRPILEKEMLNSNIFNLDRTHLTKEGGRKVAEAMCQMVNPLIHVAFKSTPIMMKNAIQFENPQVRNYLLDDTRLYGVPEPMKFYSKNPHRHSLFYKNPVYEKNAAYSIVFGKKIEH